MSNVNLTPLGDVCTITMGQAPLGSNTNVEKIGIPLIAGAGDFAPESIRPSKYTTQTTKLAKSGAIILSIRASIGDVRVADREYCLGRGVASLEALPTIDRSYLFHVVASSNEILRSRGRGATFLQISKADIASLEIPLPPLDEQRRIADLLDRAQSIIEVSKNRCQKVEILKSSLTESAIENSISWQRLEEIAEVTGGLSQNRKRQELPKQVPYLRVANVHRGSLSLSNLKHFGVSDRELKRTRVLRGDILMVEAHANQFEVGRAAILNKSISELSHQNHLFRIRSEGMPPRVLEALLNSRFARRQLIKQSKTTSGLFTINISGARSLKIPVLSQEVSKMLDRRLEDISRLQVESSTMREIADQLYTSLATRAFAGEL